MEEAQIYDQFPRRRRILAVGVLAFSNLLVVLDMTVANVSVPQIAGSLGIAPDQGAWTITSYAIADAIAVPLTGWLAQRFGSVRLFSFCLMGFGIFSLLCGLAPTLTALVAARIGQGLCGGPLMALSQSLIARIVSPEHRPGALAFWAMTIAVGPGIGPMLGGYISDNWGWHWIFFINIPIVLVCAVMAVTLMRSAETPTVQRPIDVVGLVLLVSWISAFQIILDTGHNRDWLADTWILSLAIVTLLAFLLFLVWELTDDHPVVDLKVFRHRGYAIGVLTLTIAYGAYFGTLVIIPQWLQLGLGYPGITAGAVTGALALASVPAAPIAARLVGRIDSRIMISWALCVAGVMGLVRAHWSSDVDFWTLVLPLALQGMCFPFAMVPLTLISISSVEPREVPSAAGLQNFMRTTSVAFSAALILTAWGVQQQVARSELASSLLPATVERTVAPTGLGAEAGRMLVSRLVDAEAMIVALDRVFVMASIASFIAAALIWLGPSQTMGSRKG